MNVRLENCIVASCMEFFSVFNIFFKAKAWVNGIIALTAVNE